MSNRKVKASSLFKLALLVACGYFVYHLYMGKQSAELQVGWMKQVNDSTMAVVASERASHAKELEALRDAAKSLRGELVAGVRVRTQADTAEAPMREVVTSTVADATRTATLTDTTDLGIEVTIQTEAPPYPAPLKLGYRVIVPPFEPEIGFIKVGESYTAVVSWAGQTFSAEDAFYMPERVRRPKWTLVSGSSVGGEEGFIRKPDFDLGVRRRLGSKGTLVVSGIASSYTGPELVIRYERELWSSK